MRLVKFEERYYIAINMMNSFVSFLHYYHIKYAGLDKYYLKASRLEITYFDFVDDMHFCIKANLGGLRMSADSHGDEPFKLTVFLHDHFLIDNWDPWKPKEIKELKERLDSDEERNQ